MTAVCKISGCGEIIRTHVVLGTGTHSAPPGSAQKVHEAATELLAFDQLAAEMLKHIAMRHPEQAKEMQEVGFIAGKVYAMTWAQSGMPRFAAMCSAWRKGLILRLQTDGPAGSSDDFPSGS